MNKSIVFIPAIMTLVLISVVNACVSPNRVEFYHPMDLDMLKIAVKNEKQKHEVLNQSVLIDYGDFIVDVNKNSATITCKQVLKECMDESDLRDVLEDLEDWNAYDLSKEDKDTIADLYQPGIVIRKLDKGKLLSLKIRGGILKFLGRFFCTNYEKVIACKDEWCGIQVLKSEKCLYFREKC